MPPAKLEFPLSPTDRCVKCDDNADPRLVFVKKTTAAPEHIDIYCATCGYKAGSQPCADAKPAFP